MNEREYDDLMRRALRSRSLWDEVTANESDAERAFEWISNAKAMTNDVLGRRKSEWAEVVALSDPRSAAYKAALAEYSEWRKRALGFLSIVSQRKSEMKAAHRTTRLTRAIDDREQINDSLIHLASSVASHEAGHLSDAELHGVLDDIVLPHGLNGEISLREIVALRSVTL